MIAYNCQKVSNGLLLENTKPLPESMLTSQVRSCLLKSNSTLNNEDPIIKICQNPRSPQIKAWQLCLQCMFKYMSYWTVRMKRNHYKSNYWHFSMYCQTSNIRCTIGNKIVDQSDVIGASPLRCCNYIFILNLTPGFNGLGKETCKTRQGTFKFWDLVHLIFEVWCMF